MANIWSRLAGKQEKRFDAGDYPWAGTGYSGNDLLGFGKTFLGDTEAIGNDFVGYIQGAYKASGVVFAVCEARRAIFSEMKFTYQRLEGGRPTKLFGSKDLRILEHPWPNGTTGELLSRAMQDADMAGNHFVVTEGFGENERLRRLRPDWVQIILTAAPDKAVKSDVMGYIYKPGGTDKKELWEIYPINGSNGKVAHWSPLPDPEAQYRGMSWLTPILREIQFDKQATNHKLKFFQNAATPNLAISFKETVTADQFKKFKEMMDSTKSGSDHAYETLYLGGGADVTVVGANIQEMDFKSTQGRSETRIAAAGRVHPSIVGISEGLLGSSMNEGNFRAAKDGFADGTLRPLWRSLCAAYDVLVPDKEGARLWYDMRDIAFLRHDQKELAEIRGIDATTISKLIMAGYTPESIIKSIANEDITVLEHTGLFSVQLQPPLTEEDVKAANDITKAKADDPKSGNGGNAGANGKPASGDKKPAAAKDPSKPAAKKPEAKSQAEIAEILRQALSLEEVEAIMARLDDPDYPLEGVSE